MRVFISIGKHNIPMYVIIFQGGGALGTPRESTEETGRKAANDLLEAVECGGCVDKYVQVSHY